MRRRSAGLVAGVLLLAMSAMWGPLPPAGAHVMLAASVPADGASVDQPPTEVLLTFTEAPDPGLALVQVRDEAGTRVERGRPEPVAGRPLQLRVSLGTVSQGSYTVSWRTTSAADGHTTAGSVAFGVGVAASAAAGEGATTGVQSPTAASIAGRWAFYIGVVLLLGAAVVGVGVVSNPATVSVRVLGAAWAGMALGLVVTFADQRATARASLSQLLDSSTGHKLSMQAVAVGIAGLAVVWAGLRPGRSSLGAVGAGAAGAMLARAAAGHADASSVPWFAIGVQWAHLVSVGAWVGGFAWLLIALRRGDPGQGRGLARRFSTVAATTLAVVAGTGVLRSLDEVGAWGRLVHTSFGVALLVKLGLVAGLVVAGALSRFRHVRSAGAVRVDGLRRTVRAEVVLGAAVLGAAAVLTGLPPSASLAEASRHRLVPGGTVPSTGSSSDSATPGAGCGQGVPDTSYSVTLDPRPDPPKAERTTFHITVRRDGGPVTGAKVCLAANMPDMKHPGVNKPAVETTAGSYDADFRFSMVGAWAGSVTIVEPGRPAVSVPVRFLVT